jgi:hypothetical protein
MNCRRWCFGVTVVVVAVGMGGIPAAAQQSPPAVEVPGVTLPAVTIPVPHGVPAIATPPISTPPISTPPVQTPAIVTPVGTVPSVTVPAVKIAPVTVPAVKTAPAGSGGAPATGSGESPKAGASDPPSTGASGGGAQTGRSERPAARALAVRGTVARRREAAAPAPSSPDAAEAPERRAPAPPIRGRHATATADRVIQTRPDRQTAPAALVLDDRAARAPVPVADSVERHEAVARPLVDALGRALDLVPILMALALGGALCVVSRQLRRAG